MKRIAFVLLITLSCNHELIAQCPASNASFTFTPATFNPIMCGGSQAVTYFFNYTPTPGYHLTSYNWEVTGGNTHQNSGGPQDDWRYETVTWTKSGSVHVEVTEMMDFCGSNLHCTQCFKSSDEIVTVYEAYISNGGTVTGCVGTPVTLTASTNMSSATYNWYQGAIHGGTLVQSGSSSSYQASVADKYRVVATQGTCTLSSQTTLNMNPQPSTAFTVKGGGDYCSGGTRVFLDSNNDNIADVGESGVSYSLYVHGAFITQKNTSTIEFTGVNVWGSDSVSIATIVASKNGCDATIPGYATVRKLVGSPATNYIVGGAGTYCLLPGDKVNVTLSGSQTKALYKLKNGATVIDTRVGTGGPLVFAPVTTSGTYTVTTQLNGGGCTEYTIGSSVISALPVLNAYNLSGVNYCSGRFGGTLNLDGSQTNTSYQLFKEGVPWGSPKAGTGSSLSWTPVAAGGHYSVIATSPSTPCPRTMNGIPMILKLQPARFTVTGGGTVCNSATATIGLSGSELNVNYQLKNGNDLVPNTSIPGTKYALTWNGIAGTGTYTVVASSALMPSCTREMLDSAKVQGSPVVAISVTEYPCTYGFSSTITGFGSCGVTSYSWRFGDGSGPSSTSTDAHPFHTYANSGTYHVILDVTTSCDGTTCTSSGTIDVVVNLGSYTFPDFTFYVTTNQREKILNTSATTYSDAWTLPFELQQYSDMNPFLSGERGVWRNEGQYAYKANRSQSTPVNVATDGTFTMDFFNWQQSFGNAIPDWIKANTMTQYSPYSYELESKDVMDIYSAAVYDYKGQLVTAQGSNMRNEEMAFTGFETDLNSGNTGNWTFGTKLTQTSATYPVYYAKGNLAIVVADFGEFTDVNKVDVHSWFFEDPSSLADLFGFNSSRIPNDPIVCKQAYSGGEGRTVLVLGNAPFDGQWGGTISIRKSEAGITAVKDAVVKHTGASSLQIATEKAFKQPQLNLISGKTYFVSAWVSIGNNVSYSTPTLRSGLGIDVKISDKTGLPVNTVNLTAAGPIIEGWQQVNGTFDVTIPDSQIELVFKPGSGTAWFDDLRLHPNNGIMKSFVYDLKDYRLTAILDEQNFASLFYYDNEGNLFLTKKDTERGRKTISENISYLKKTQSGQ